MKRLKINGNNSITFKEVFEVYIDNCKARNLREGTIKHYNECYKSITRFIDEDSYISDFTIDTFNSFIKNCRKLDINDIKN